MIKGGWPTHVVISAFLLLFVSMPVACSGGTEPPVNSATPTPKSGGYGGGGRPSEEFVAVLRSLPVFPGAQLANGDSVEGQYPTGGSTGGNLTTGFFVAAGSVTPEEITGFFAKELPKSGWYEEARPWTYGGEKEGAVVRTVIYSFLHQSNGLRLAVSIPLVHKDAPDGVSNVNIDLMPKDTPFFSSPIATPIDTTPIPTPDLGPSTTPGLQPSGTEKPVIETHPAPTTT